MACLSASSGRLASARHQWAGAAGVARPPAAAAARRRASRAAPRVLPPADERPLAVARRGPAPVAGASAVEQQGSQPDARGGLPPLPPLNAGYEAASSFADYANWLVPGRLLVGRYPYVEPSRCSSYSEAEARLGEIVARGPHVFVSLQAELPAQSQMPIGGVGGFLPYKAVAELMAAAHTPPPPGDVVNGVRNPTLDKFLPQRKRAPNPEVEEYYSRERVAFLHYPIPDAGVPTMDELREIVGELKGRLARGEAVYLHGWRGCGRPGLVGAALLADAYGLSADEALERVQRSADTRCDGGDGLSPETEAQRRMVREFVAAAGRQ